MNKKNYMKKTLSSIVVSTCAMVAIPAIANNIATSQQGLSLVSKEIKGSFINGEDANLNPNFKVSASLVGTVDNDKGVFITSEYKNNFPMVGGPTFGWYYDVAKWEKSYDGITFTKVEPNGYDKEKNYYIFNREDKEFQIRRVVDWCYNNMEDVTFTTNSAPIKVNKKMSSNVVVKNNSKEKADYRIELNSINDNKENIKFTLTKEHNGTKTIIDSSNNNFGEISSFANIKKDGSGFFYDLKNVDKQIVAEKYTFDYEIITNDTTRRKDKITFDARELLKTVYTTKPVVLSESNDFVTIKVVFEKYKLVNDYTVKFVEIDESYNAIPNKYPKFEKINDTEYKIFKSDSNMRVSAFIQSAMLGVNYIDAKNFINVVKKSSLPVNPENPSLPDGELPNDNNGIVNSNQNSSYNTSTIAIITILSLISLISVICSIIFFINMRKNNK